MTADPQTYSGDDVPAAHDPANDDAYREPQHSTVDDWLGQRVDRDRELADEVLEESGGDERQAERLFDERSNEGEEYHESHEQGQR